MNTKKHLKTMLSCLICLAMVASSVAIFIPECYAGEQSKLLADDAASQDSTTTQDDPIDQEDSDSTSDDTNDASENEAGDSSNSKSKKKKKSNAALVVAFAKKQTGKPYRYGAFGPSSFDCIGFVYYVFANTKADLKTSMTRKKANNLKNNFSKYIVSHSLKDAKAGDIIAYYSGGKTRHAAIATGNGKAIWAHYNGGIKSGKLKGYGGCSVAVIRIVK